MAINTYKTNVFDDLQAGRHRMDYLPRSVEAQNYYRRKARQLTSLTPERLLRTSDPNYHATNIPNTKSIIGHMVLFHYDPKHKKTLPFYDRYPLTFILRPLKDGFIGLNFHYLPYQWRAFLLNRLQKLATNKRYDETTRLNMTYTILAAAAELKAFRPCLKRYLSSHVRSKFLWIPAYDWEIAIFLPVQRFIKESQQSVWNKSLKYIHGK